MGLLTKEDLLKKLDEYKKLRDELAFYGKYFQVNVKDGSEVLCTLRGLDITDAIERHGKYVEKGKYCYIYDELEQEALDNRKISMYLECLRVEENE